MEKEYTVIANTREDLPALEAEITASSGAGPIPNRSVDIANPRLGSKIQTHFMLTDAEAEELRNDPRVRAVEIPPEQRDDISIGLNALQEAVFFRGGGLVDTHANWGLRRCIENTNVYGSSSAAPTDKYQYAIDGTGVDVVIQDSGIDPNHPDWNFTREEIIESISSTNSFVSSNNGSVLALDLGFALDTNIWQDDYINKTMMLRFISSVDNSILLELQKTFDGNGNSPAENEFVYNGSSQILIGVGLADNTSSITSASGTLEILFESSASRLMQIDWYTESGLPGSQSANHYRDLDGHGSHCTSIAAGKLYGWAKGAHIYAQKLSGLETLGGSDGTGISIADAFDCIRLWHNNKTNGRPTVVNMSWGYGANVTGDPDGGVYRGTAWTWGVDYNTRSQLQAATGVSQNYFSGGTSHRIPVRVASVDAEVDDMITDGVHVCIAAGNNLHKADLPAGADYDNEVTFAGVTRTYHRGSSPYSLNAFMVGNIDSEFTQAAGGNYSPGDLLLDQTATSSTRGPGVNMWAPGSDIMAATSTQYDTGSYTVTDYPDTPGFPIMKIGGTSMASPQVCGVVAQHLQVHPTLSPAQMQTRINSDSPEIVYSTGSDVDYDRISDSIMGSTPRILYSRYGRQPIVANGDAIALFSIQGTSQGTGDGGAGGGAPPPDAP